MKNYSIVIATPEKTLIQISSFRLQENTLQFLFGESGIGKTLVSKTIYGVLDPSDWHISINEQSYNDYRRTAEFHRMRKNGYFVFQEPSTHFHPMETIAQQLNLYTRAYDPFRLEIYRSFFSESEWHRLVMLYPSPHRPSGGEKQRMFLIRAFLKIRHWQICHSDEPALFIFDEPTAHLDNHYRKIFYDLLVSLYRQKPFTALLISHDYSVVLRMRNIYPDLQKNICYDEFYREDGQIQVRKFDPEQFIAWHAQLQPIRKPQPAVPLLTVESGVQIFQRTYGFQTGHHQPVTLVIPKSAAVYLKAPSGFGKTLMVKSLMGLIPTAAFRMKFADQEILAPKPERFWAKHLWGRRMVMVFQHADETLNTEAPVIEHFRGLPLKHRLPDKEIIRRFSEWFNEPLLTERFRSPVKTFSGGQKQRIALFRALLLEPELLILDEPFNGLDFTSLRRVLQTLIHSVRNGTSLLLISHDEELIESFIPEDAVVQLIRMSSR